MVPGIEAGYPLQFLLFQNIDILMDVIIGFLFWGGGYSHLVMLKTYSWICFQRSDLGKD